MKNIKQFVHYVIESLVGKNPEVRALEEKLKRTEENLRETQSSLSTLKGVVTNDNLGLPNELSFLQGFCRVVTAYEREHFSNPNTEKEVALFCLDMDGFKQINDNYGHDGGDKALQFVVHGMRKVCRGGDVVARLHGDEFVIAALVDGKDGARHLGQKILHFVHTHKAHVAEGVMARVGLSMGAVCFKPDALLKPDRSMTELGKLQDTFSGLKDKIQEILPYNELVKGADTALYTTKRAGKDNVTVVSASDLYDLVVEKGPNLPVSRERLCAASANTNG